MSVNIIIVGRSNVGKSTLFNRLIGRRLALVHDIPGVTRDLREGYIKSFDGSYKLIDTAGFEDIKKSFLNNETQNKTKHFIKLSNLALFVVDGRSAISKDDLNCLSQIRKMITNIILVVNKCEGSEFKQNFNDFYSLGLGEPIFISAEHGNGIDDLLDSIKKLTNIDNQSLLERKYFSEPPNAIDGYLKLTVVGRPNTGKSTLFNYLAGSQRVITSSMPGMTRDSIQTRVSFNDKVFNLIDTAGLRRKSKVVDVVEKLSAMDTIKAIKISDIVILLIDATQLIDKQDLTIASSVISEGKVLVIGLNKWDLVNNQESVFKIIKERLEESLSQVKGLEIVTLSSKTGLRVTNLVEISFKLYHLWEKRLETSKLNRWLETITRLNPPPLSSRKKTVKLKYITQVKSKPPSFIIFTTSSNDVSESYKRFLKNDLTKQFKLHGIPIKLNIRKQKNPYG